MIVGHSKMKAANLLDMIKKHQGAYDIKSSTTSKEKRTSVPEHETESKESCIKCRHVVALIGFGVFAFLSIHRMNMTVSIVAMVNATALHRHGKPTSESCPAPNLTKAETLSAKLVEGDFDWTPITQGYILSSSFLGYICTQFIAGKAAETFGCKWIIFWGTFLSSLCTALTPLSSYCNVYILIVAQTIRGMAQGVFQPALSVLIANWFPKSERGGLSTFMLTGQCIGALVGGFFSGILCDSALFGGWPSVFYIFGVSGAFLSLLIAIFLYESPDIHPSISKAEVKFILSDQENALSQRRPNTPWRDIFTSVPFYALALACFGQCWAATHFLAVHPTFLGTILHFSIEQNGLFSSVPFVLQTLLALIASWISAFLNRRSYVGVDKVRKFWNSMACVGYSLCLVGIYLAQCNKLSSIIFSMLAMGFVGLAFAGCIIVPADMSPTFAGSVMGLVCTFGSTASFILPLVVGFLTNGMQTLEQWNKLMFISIGVVMTSGIIFAVFGSAEVQSWNFVEKSNDTAEEEDKRKEIIDKWKRSTSQ